jgi:AcrR family transcriptional regulator
MTVDDVVPEALRRLWGISAPSRVGRPAELDSMRVITAAVELADRAGLAGVTLPRVAKELGYTSMSLYRYVGSKDELLALMADAALGEPPDIGSGTGWRDGLRRFARAERDVYLRRHWLARVPISGPPSGPHQIAWMEAALTALRGTGLEWTEKVSAMTLISGYVRHMAVLSQDLAAGLPAGSDQASAERDYGRALAKLVDPDRFPETAKLFASDTFEAAPAGSAEHPDPDNDFALGLELILDGVAAAVSRAGT